MFDIYMANFNDWTFADSSYTAVTTQSVLNLGVFASDYDTMSKITI